MRHQHLFCTRSSLDLTHIQYRYDATLVPVGDDQLQHIELCRDVARAFNSRFIPSHARSEYLRLPSAVLSGSSSSMHRIMSLENPRSKMSKSDASSHAAIFLDDSNDRCPPFALCVWSSFCHGFDAFRFSYGSYMFLPIASRPKSSVQ